jgi:hypothetical protein
MHPDDRESCPSDSPLFLFKDKTEDAESQEVHQKNLEKSIGGVTPHPNLCHNALSRCTLMIGGVALATLLFFFLKG